jgi:hypothetical protein
VEDFILAFIQFDKLPFEKLFKVIKSEKGEYHLIVVPPRNCGWRRWFDESTNWGMDTLIKGLKKVWTGVRIKNLVFAEDHKDENLLGRDAAKADVLAEPKYPEQSEPQCDIVITCMIREGLDWCPCSRLHVTYAEGSTVLAIQTLGRVTRRFRAGDKPVPWLRKRYAKDGKGKTTIVIRRYLKTLPKPKDGMTTVEAIEDFKNVQLVLMRVDSMYLPIFFEQNGTPTKHSKSKTGKKNWSLQELKEDFSPLLTEFEQMMLELEATDASEDAVDAGLMDLLTKYKVPIQHHRKAISALKGLYARRIPKYTGVDIEWVRKGGFTKLWKNKEGQYVAAYGIKGRKDLAKVVCKAFDQMLKDAHKFIKKASDWNDPKYSALKSWALKGKMDAKKQGKW